MVKKKSTNEQVHAAPAISKSDQTRIVQKPRRRPIDNVVDGRPDLETGTLPSGRKNEVQCFAPEVFSSAVDEDLECYVLDDEGNRIPMRVRKMILTVW